MKKLLITLLVAFLSPAFATECPDDKPMEYKGECYLCNNSNNLFSETECNKCPEYRQFKDGICFFKKSPFPDTPLFNIGWSERMCPKCRGCKCDPDKKIETDFVSCNYSGKVLTTPENCSICPTRFAASESSIMSSRIKNVIECLDCSAINAYLTTEESCTRCPNRIYENGFCSLKHCPKGTFRLEHGECWKCSAYSNAHVKNKTDCEVCPEREYKNGTCILKECPEGYIMDFRQFYDGCTPCTQIDKIKVTEEECNKCPDRVYSDGVCWEEKEFRKLEEYTKNIHSNSCDSGWIFVNEHCEKCDTSDVLKVSESECLTCNLFEELRVYNSQSGECRLKK